MKTAIDYFSAKQVHENPRATEKDDGSEDQALVQVREDNIDFADIVIARLLPVYLGRQSCHQQNRRSREQVNQDRSLAEEVLSNLEPQYRCDLAAPQRPRAAQGWLGLHNDFGSAHPPSPPPIKY